MAQARKKSIDGIFATHQASFAMKVFKLLESLAVAVLVKRETDYASVCVCVCGGRQCLRVWREIPFQSESAYNLQRT